MKEKRLYNYTCQICKQVLEADYLMDIIQLYQDHNCSETEFGIKCNHCGVGIKSNKEYLLYQIEKHSCTYIENTFKDRSEQIEDKEFEDEIAKDCRAGIL
jgi:hypothetical protein